MGRVIGLSGASSAGKTSLGRALQKLLPDHHLIGVDTMLTTIPERWYSDGHITFANRRVETDARFRAAEQQWRHAVAAFVAAGAEVILDEVLLSGRRDQELWDATLPGIVWVKVHLPLEIQNQREKERGNRLIGQGEDQAGRCHEGVVYALEVDTSTGTPDELATRLVAQLEELE